MNINIVAFGIAKDIIQGQTMELELTGMSNVGNLKTQLCKQFPDFEKLKSLSIAVNEEYQKDEFILSENDEVVIIPPVSGG